MDARHGKPASRRPAWRTRPVAIVVIGVVMVGAAAVAADVAERDTDAATESVPTAVAQAVPSDDGSAHAEQLLGRELDQARAAARSARSELDAAIASASETLDESEGRVPDDALRRELRRVLEAAGTARDLSLDGANADELREAAALRARARDDVVAATEDVRKARIAWQAERDRDAAESEAREDAAADADAEALAEGWHDAESAARCSAPDQVWTPENGHLPDSALAAIPWSRSDYVRSDVLEGFVELDAAFRERFGRHLEVNSSYRTHAEQEALYDPGSDTAAPPGCSNHGTGLAVDLGGGVERFGSIEYEWLKANAQAHGWVHPPFAEPDGRNPEPWHWQSVLAPNSF